MKIDLVGNLFRTEAVRIERYEDIFKTVFPVKIEDVIYIENFNRKTMMVTVKGEFIVSAPFSKLKKFFAENELFVSGHCSYLLNKSFFERFEENFVVLCHGNDEFKLPVARRKAKDFREKYVKNKGAMRLC